MTTNSFNFVNLVKYLFLYNLKKEIGMPSLFSVDLFPLFPLRPARYSRGLEGVSPHRDRNIFDKGQQQKWPNSHRQLTEPELPPESRRRGKGVHLAGQEAVSPGAQEQEWPSIPPLVPGPGGRGPAETWPVQRGQERISVSVKLPGFSVSVGCNHLSFLCVTDVSHNSVSNK